MINRHLLKNRPLYVTKENRKVTLLNVIDTDECLLFMAKIILPGDNDTYEDVGKWTQCYKKDICLLK